MVSTKIGQIFSFVQSKVPNRWLQSGGEGPFSTRYAVNAYSGFALYSRAASPMALSRRATSISSANRDQTCAICSMTALVCSSDFDLAPFQISLMHYAPYCATFPRHLGRLIRRALICGPMDTVELCDWAYPGQLLFKYPSCITHHTAPDIQSICLR